MPIKILHEVIKSNSVTQLVASEIMSSYSTIAQKKENKNVKGDDLCLRCKIYGYYKIICDGTGRKRLEHINKDESLMNHLQ